MLLEFGDMLPRFCQLSLRIFLFLLQALVLHYHVFGAVPDSFEFTVNFHQGRI